MNFRHRITIQQDNSNAGDEVGNTDWAEVAKNIPCNIHGVRGKESFRGVKLEASTHFLIELRYLTGIEIKPEYRIKDSHNRFMSISSVTDKDERQRYLYLHCTQVDP